MVGLSGRPRRSSSRSPVGGYVQALQGIKQAALRFELLYPSIMSFNSYIAGLNLPFTVTDAQATNGFAWASLVGSFYLTFPGSDFKKKVEREAGKAIHMPPGKSAQIISGTHGMALFIPAGIFLFSLPFNQFVTPSWLLKTALPATYPEIYYGLRVAASIGCVGTGVAMISIFKHLGSQWNYIGVSRLLFQT